MTLQQQLCEALNDRLSYTFMSDEHCIVIPMNQDGLQQITVVHVDESSHIISLILQYERKAPENRREELCVLFAQANCSFLVGGLVMDPADGECQFRQSVSMVNIAVSSGLLLRLVSRHIDIGMQYWRGIAAVMDGADYREGLASMS
jgi:hypothetical protein